MRKTTRRTFLRETGKAAAGAAVASSALTAAGAERVKGANERVNIAMIGCGGRGRYVAYGLMEKGATLTCLCDLHPVRLQQCWQFLSRIQKAPPKLVNDMQEVLDAKDVDAVMEIDEP